jgi:eukaryotic-like serine/threonine-protein kinase
MKDDVYSCPVTPLPKAIGPYKILKKIAAGGMGEVYLAQDPFCKRNIALKKIRSDRMDQSAFKERFLKEVKIAAQLSHPSIIPIYQIHQTDDDIYYTMPFIEGETLKEILRKTLKEEKQGLSSHPVGSSIPALMRIFFNMCQAVAYSHSKGVLHRDLKPENIIIGKYGEVLILDWGLAEFASRCHDELPIEEETLEKADSGLTRPGKVAGTLSYLPPERVFGDKATYSSDIYALGVILYQLLTLKLPFRHKTVKEYKKQMKHNLLVDPAEKAPYREIPPQLSKIAKKCLARHYKSRYSSIQEILQDLNNYIEGYAEWSPCASIQIEHKTDWEFQENILLAKQIALTQKSDIMEWVNLMIAKRSFSGNIKFETHIRIKDQGQGIGFLFTMPSEEGTKDFFQKGYSLWIGSELNPGISLFRSNVEVMSTPDFYLKEQMSHFVKIEKTDNHLRIYLDNVLAFDYLSHIPLNIPHFGVILKDDELDVGAILISSSSPNIQVNCLAVPDAFFALKNFKQALIEYRQIGRSFLGRTEGREAIFRAGITLLEQAQTQVGAKKKEDLFRQTLEEFGQLKNTPGAPLEYLGKALVYKATHELEEEMKCLELALCKFSKHPLIHLIKDQILFRLHEASYKDRKAAHHLALLTLRYIPEAFSKQDNQILLQNLKKSYAPIPFLYLDDSSIYLQLAFNLYKPFVLEELLQKTPSFIEKTSIFFCLLNLGFSAMTLEMLKDVEEDPKNFTPLKAVSSFYESGIVHTLKAYFTSPQDLLNPLMKSTFLFLFDPFQKVKFSLHKEIIQKLEKMAKWDLPEKETLLVKHKLIEWLLFVKKTEDAQKHLREVPKEEIDKEDSPFHFFNICLIANKNGVETAKKHLSRHDGHSLSSLFCLIDRYLSKDLSERKQIDKELFFWEKIQLLKQLYIFYQSANLEALAKASLRKLNKEILDARSEYSYT